MHYAILVVAEGLSSRSRPGREHVEEAVEGCMEAWRGTWFDWYQIGGRWTGLFDGYDPEDDPANLAQCLLCWGTGVRSDDVGIEQKMPEREIIDAGHKRFGQIGWCNGCDGRGMAVEWPTGFKAHDGDWIEVENLTEEHLRSVYRVVVEGWGEFSRQRYEPWRTENHFVALDFPPLGWIKNQMRGGFAVIVDCHD